MMKSFSRMETASLLSTAAAVAARPRSSHHAPALAMLALGALSLGAGAGPAGAASTRISDPDVPSFSDVSVTVSSQISPDGQYAVYAQDAATDGAFELWSVRLDNTTPPQRLTGPLTAGQAPSFEISSGSPARVVYRVDQETPGKLELYSVLIAGGARTKLNPNMASNRDVYSFRLSPTGDRVFFTSDLEIYERGQLYSVPIAGGTAVRLNADLVFDFDIGNYQVSPDGGTVVYTDFRNASGERELWSVPALGPMESAVKINRSLNGGAVEDYYKISDDSDTVVYSANATASQRSDLYSVPIHGGTSTLLNTGSVSSHSVEPTFLISSDDLNPRVVFRSAPLSSAVYQLYSVPLGGGAVNRLNGSLGSGEAVATGFDISPDGNWVVYRSDEGTDNIYDLYSAPITGGTPIRLNEELEAYADVLGSPSFPDFQISPDSQRVVFLADQSIDTVNDLWSAPITGNTVATKLNSQLAAGGDVQAFRISPDSNWVVYGADQDADTVDELLRVQIGGGAIQDVNGPLVNGGDVTLTRLGAPAFQISAANSIDVLYTADENINDKIELYLWSAAGPPGPPTNVVGSNPGDQRVTVTFSAPSNTGGSPITGYTVTSHPAGGVVSLVNGCTTCPTRLVTSLVNGTPYTFTVTATNANGLTSGDSAPSVPVTPATTPGAPTGVSAVPWNQSAMVTFLAPTITGGSPITGYWVTPSPATEGWRDNNAGSSSLTHEIAGLENDTDYQFTVRASNIMGMGASSEPFPTVPVAPYCDVFCDGFESGNALGWLGEASVSITKTDGSATEIPGTPVTYTIVVSNAGPDAASSVTVADTFTGVLSGCSSTCVGAGGGSCAAGPVLGSWVDNANLPAGGSATYTSICNIARGATGSLVNTATATVAGNVADPNPLDNSATDTDTLTPEADLAITKTDGVLGVTAGQTTTYTIVASNAGPSDASAATVIDIFEVGPLGWCENPAWTCIGEDGGICGTAGGLGTIWEDVDLPVGGTVTFTAGCTVSLSAPSAIANTATVVYPQEVSDPSLSNNGATDTDAVEPPPS